MPSPVHVIGGGLAGSECAYQLARRGVPVILWEMRPEHGTPAHQTGAFAELVCSNSLRSDDPHHAAGLLKREMEAFGSLILTAARAEAVPAGSALAVDRDRFSARVSAAIEAEPAIEIRRREVLDIPDGDVVVATGPLTSLALTERLRELLGGEHLYFFDAIAPIVDAETLDHELLFRASRWGKGGDDYLNAPLDRDQYLAFWRALVEAEKIVAHPSERDLFFEGCLPVEELARRGEDTLRYGPMKPVGLRLPDGRRPYAVVQLRQENLARTHYNLVGFQSRLRWTEQKRVLRMIPGLGDAEFVRLGQVHRNTFVNSPIHLDRWYRLRHAPRIRLAGQLTGVEGYLESAATGLLCALYLFLERADRAAAEPLPDTTALGALARHLTESDPARFQPANINYGLLLPLDEPTPRRERRGALAARARTALQSWIARHPFLGEAGLAVARADIDPVSIPAR
ncbi:MAG TPA: methylenetetrahydrofolate--tRNA-(uracil(54)-C(5))-methyltransferase (FADH(2)-oxidizing) TrmFO [Thermoanaerobaculia bacterium]|nr:methylenetetrahydrofolate--tRNA-(uracil(54)-C(5))-methyltransferase (FADH(2)-oxidizing) TrmFO [Thermoanaerobaculia bacterium]